MKKFILLLIFCGLSIISIAQFAVGHTTLTFNDPNRTGGFGSGGGPGRQIQTEIYYPATTVGTNTPMVNGNFPIIVFGHGFVMSWDVYAPFYNHWAAKGYVVALPRTEGGFSPSHLDFAEDLGIVAHKLQDLATLATSPFYQNLSSKIGIGGHSMGGGAAILSTPYQITGINCYLTFAAAETNPSAIQAATISTAPSLFLSGSYDCVVPTATQTQIYDSMASSCKAQIEFTNAYHCQFNAFNLNCATGEATCFTSGGIARDTQINRSLAYADDFLAFHLKDQCTAWTSFKNKYDNNVGVLTSKKMNCTYSIPNAPTVSFNGTNLVANGAGFNLYLWKRNGTIIPSSGLNTFTPTLNGNYSVCAYTTLGCYLESAPYLFNTLGVKEAKIKNNVRWDAQNKYLYINSEKPNTLKIVSLSGALIHESQNEQKIYLGALAKGMYIAELQEQNGMYRQLILIP